MKRIPLSLGRNSFVTWTTGLKERIQKAEKENVMRNYRGLTKEGNWVYGWYVFDVEWAKHYIYNSTDFTRGAFYILGRYEVIPETVGQSTGLKDKNGTEIYEGDIVKHTIHKTDGEKEWDEIRIYEVKWQFIRWTIEGAFVPWGENKHMIVIGNKWEHPKLLEQDNGR